MSFLNSLIEDIESGETPELILHDLENRLVPLVGKLPDNRDDFNTWVNSSLAVFYLLRYVFLTRYYPGGHERIDLLHKAAGLLPGNALDNPNVPDNHVDLEA